MFDDREGPAGPAVEVRLDAISLAWRDEFFLLCRRMREREKGELPEIVAESRTREDCDALLIDCLEKRERSGAPDFFVFVGGRLAGIVGFYPVPRGAPVGELGIWLSEEYRRMGAGKTAMAEALAHGFRSLGYSRIEALVAPGDAASEGLVRRLGMRRLGRRSEPDRYGSLELDCYSMDRDAWAEARGGPRG